MTLYAVVLIVKHEEEYWVSEVYKITNNFNTSHCMRSISSHSNQQKMCWIAPPFCFLTAFSRFSIVQWIFAVSMVTSFHLFLIAYFRSCRLANGSHRPLYTKSCTISQMQSSKELRSGEYDAHSSSAIKSGVFCRRNCCVTLVRRDETVLQEFKVIARIMSTTFRQ